MIRRLGVAALAAAVTLAGLAPAAAAQEGIDAPTGFSDVTGGVHKPAIDALDELGLFDGTECGQQQFCPGEQMKRWTMAVWLVRVLDEAEPPAADESSFADVDFEKWWLPHVERLAELEVTKGCLVDPLRYCPDRSVTRAEMATFLTRAFDLEEADPAGFIDTGGNFHEADIDALAAAGITAGCATGPLRYCPDKPVTRAEMATFLARALGLVEIPEPPAQPPSARPGEGVRITAARANWTSGYFQAELHRLLLEELGYEVSDPAENELSPNLAYIAMARGEIDYWPNSWYPGHLMWHDDELPDGSLVGDNISIVGEEMQGLQGFLVTKSFADTYGVYTMDELNRNADALAAFDATDPRPGNGKADIYGCAEFWTCDNIITNMIAFGGWDNIAQVVDTYDPMFAQALDAVNNGIPMVIYTWAPTRYIAQLRPGDNVYWMGVDEVLDDSNPANQPNGHEHNQRGLDGTRGYEPVSADQCPSAADQPDGLCKIGWIAADIRVTANNDFLAANPAAKALFEAVKLPVVDVSEANVGVNEGRSPRDLAVRWVADNRSLVDQWLDAARAAGPGSADEIAEAGADPAACRPPGVQGVTAGFPLPSWAAPSIGTIRVAVLFLDFPDVEATYSTELEAAHGLPFAEEYLEAASYGRLDVEFVPLHVWLRAPRNAHEYLVDTGIGGMRVNPGTEAIRLADPRFDFTGHHIVMTVLPSAHFNVGDHTSGRVDTDEGMIHSTARINTAPHPDRGGPEQWGTTAAHELAHGLGLTDLYSYDARDHELPEAPANRRWIRTEFGLMGLRTAFIASPSDRRLSFVARLPGRTVTVYNYSLNAEEMLAWSRWQLGWIDESQVRCITGSGVTVVLGPVSDPGDSVTMAVVPLSTSEVLVMESRRKIGYDSGREYRDDDGVEGILPVLAHEGVLVYTVDARLYTGELPARLAGDRGDGLFDDYPLLTRGQQVTVRGYTITVIADHGDTHAVQITKGRR